MLTGVEAAVSVALSSLPFSEVETTVALVPVSVVLVVFDSEASFSPSLGLMGREGGAMLPSVVALSLVFVSLVFEGRIVDLTVIALSNWIDTGCYRVLIRSESFVCSGGMQERWKLEPKFEDTYSHSPQTARR